jgi:predicted deacylase
MTQLPKLRAGHLRKEQGYIKPVDGIEIPFRLIEGSEPGPCLLVTGGVHGSEFCSIEAASRLLKLDPDQIRGTLLVLPILNVRAFHARSIAVMPEDGKNLNRMFPGRADGSESERLANWLVSCVFPHVDAYLDLHGGDLCESLTPFTVFPETSEASLALARAFGLPIMAGASLSGSGTCIGGASALGVPSIIAEVSGNGLWNEASVALLINGVSRVMGHLGMLKEDAPQARQAPDRVVYWSLGAPVDGFWYPAKKASDAVAVNEVLGEIRDVFGEVLATIRSEKAGLVLYHLSSLSVNKGESLFGMGTLSPAA